jgi:hypothetical protein
MQVRFRHGRVLASTLPLLLLLGASAVHAMGPLRCDGRIIQRGVSAVYVLSLCGEPQLMYSETGPVRSAVPGGFTRPAGFFLSEIWVYDRGFGRFPAELHFRDGILRRIDYSPHRSRQRQ